MTTVSGTDITSAIERGAEALLARRRPDGAFGDDAPASILGTAGAIAALHAADPAGNADLVEAGAAWLRDKQFPDGGWGGVVGAPSAIVPTSIATAALAMTTPERSAEAIEAGRAALAALGGVNTVADRAVSLMCRQFLAMAGFTEDAGKLRRLPLEIVLFDKVRRRLVSFRTTPFVGLALMQADLLPAGPLRRMTLRRARPAALALLRSVHDHEGRTGAFSEDPWPAALVLLGLARSGEAPDVAEAIAGWLRRAVRPDGSWDAVTNLDLTRSGYAATGLIAAGYAGDPRLRATKEFFHANQTTERFAVLDVPAGGWSFSNRRGWPVTLESAEILSALAGLPGAESDPVLRTGLDWLAARQDSRGSWSLWVRDTKLPIDGPCPAITSQAITALHEAGHPTEHPAITAAAEWLLTAQNPDGTFDNLWYRDHTTGTAVVVSALSLAGHAQHAVVRKAVAWLLDTQLPDGSWGPGDGTEGSVEETGWVVQGLLAAGGGADVAEAVDRGVAWLVAAARPEGGWPATRVCNYIRHHVLYPNAVITQAVALKALGEYRAATETSSADVPGTATR
ncbi:prenyltransferase/squalene oxidase repeat-containing protein [Labedaea rhizosphaerae]|uniref:Squalene-hopene/tetraprenyl-beta-curcumene cyclase n=1 Tax=Labedaea rhizosphaerae TaxID=598644 RepID=A0A4R6S0L8_LABRH|nr:prenyltransferase/squalene oxidase repeat-containing protein [Labedaea rhizosphaerae]TDP92990.1 squalene-hopene/tetraprenyl-beta-curcumene cyclase [Labedaea rhizosphaerae]